MNPYPFKLGETDAVSDDGVAQTIMLQLGLWDYFAKETPKNLMMAIGEEHPTHWCLCFRHSHHHDPKENGFQIIAYPKTAVGLLTVQGIMHKFLKGATDITAEFVELKPLD